MGVFGLSGLDTQQAAELARKNQGALPAGLQGYEGMDLVSISALAKRNKDTHPVGLQGYGGFGGGSEDFDAFAGLGETAFRSGTRLNKGEVEDFIEDDDDDDDELGGFGDFGEGLQSWHSNFNLAATARTETDVIKLLKKAVISVPDSTPADVKTDYYNLAIKMLHRRKASNLRHLDVKRAELNSGLGWLVNPSLPKRGGFEAAMQKAVGAVGSALAKEEAPALKSRSLFDLGNKLKSNLAKVHALAGYGDDAGAKSKVPLLVGIGVAAAVCWYVCDKNKKKKKATARKASRRRKALRARKARKTR
jgi:hypothetical protein